MQFLQPILLAGLPLAVLPILIHLINRQRHRTVRWAAMMFLLDAKRMNRGMARLRYWLIMAMRMLAIAVLVFAISRPIMSGWMGLVIGGRPDTTIIVLDRSVSMEQLDARTRQSKRSTGLRKLSEMIRTFGSGMRVVLIENTENTPREIELSDSLIDLPETADTATSSDLPAMLQTALDYVVANQTGRTDIWICSDLRENDWIPDDGRWSAVREGFALQQGVQFYLLSYPELPRDNVAVWVSSARTRLPGPTMERKEEDRSQAQTDAIEPSGTGNVETQDRASSETGRTALGGSAAAELVLDIELKREFDSNSNEPLHVPLELVINGARSVLELEITGSEAVLQGHPVALDETTTEGWGRIEIPADDNLNDNVFYFTFAEPPEHRTMIVSEDPRVADVLRLAAVSPPDPALSFSADVLTPERALEIDWKAASLILWHGPLPDGLIAQQLSSFVAGGRPVIFLPPKSPASNELFGLRWQEWNQASGQAVRVASWRGDSDLLRHTRSNAALPVNELRTHRYCSIAGAGNALARLDGGAPLLTRPVAETGPVYYFATLPLGDYSNLAQQGVVFYVMIQRALSLGAGTQGKARQVTTGSQQARELAAWTSLDSPLDEALATARPFHPGAFRNGDRLMALNRLASEDGSDTLDAAAIQQLFSGLDYRLVEDRVGNDDALASEIWRAFVCIMAAALLLEAWLCMPQRPAPVPEAAVG